MEKLRKAAAPSARRPFDGTGVRRIPGRRFKETLTIATWNVRSLLRPEKVYNVNKEMQRLNIDILGVSDVRWRGNGKHQIDADHIMYYSGSEESSNLYGVGVIINSKTVKGNISFVPRSNRAMLIHIEAKPRNIDIVQLYAPTVEKSEQEIEDFYREVEHLLEIAQKHEMCIVMGDMNAKIGEGEVQGVVGKYGLGERNDRGDILVQFCQENDLVVMNTHFQLPVRRRYTWTSPRHTSQHIIRNQIDYLMINNRFRNCIKSVKTYPGADISSDHNPVVAKLTCTLKQLRKRVPRIMVDISKMKEPEIRAKVSNDINEWAVNAGQVDHESVAEAWSQLKNKVNDINAEHLKPGKWVPKQAWMTDKIYLLMEERRKFKNIDSTKYNSLNKTIRREVRYSRNKWYVEKCDYVEELHAKHDAFNLHKEIKSMVGHKTLTNQLVDNNDHPIVDLTKKKDGLPILRDEIRNALYHAKTGKAAGPDGIYVEILKLIEDEHMDALTNLFNLIYDLEQIPIDWLRSTFVTLPKKKNAKKCEEYRTISLMSQVLKLFLKIIHARIRVRCDEQLGDSQFGFRAGVGTREALFAVQVLVQKCKDMQQDVFLCFIDYEKAFDRVLHDRLIAILKDIGLDDKDVRIIQNLYWNQRATVRVDGEETDEVEIKRGVRQGCILSPTLFNLYSEAIIVEALEEMDCGVMINGRVINNLRYADDTVLIASTEAELQLMVNRVNECSLRAGLRMNVSKTKVMVITKKETIHPVISVAGSRLERVRKYKYLGTWVNEDWDSNCEIRTRIEIARSAFNEMRRVLCSRSLKISLRTRLLQCYIWPILLYGCEAWTIKEDLRKRIEAFEMWAYRRMLAISWTHRVTNVEVLRRAGRSRQLMQTIKKRKVAYLGHVLRHDRYELLQLIMMGKVAGKRAVGRRKKSWLRNIREWTGVKSAAELFRLAKDRIRYAELTANLH
ncbi:hypothetical protein MSG28_010075 [Choristoneura fumiferana]|uniref:Uncharacterized protein n=1 Tax=Choristoneura fumiferana TaxID=7141 RepID=A0ACC0KJ98_CHOFU|nr:hypothetical protein MSG28_010075 [Choristoneura fumiferana]